MKNKTLMSLVLLTFVTVGAAFAPRVFAQTPTLDKLKFTQNGNSYIATPVNNQISGAVVIPATDPSGKKVTAVGGFQNCKNITSVIIPDGIGVNSSAFSGCDNLTSVTFQGTSSIFSSSTTIPGDLRAKYLAGGAGTYTRSAGGTNWTKQSSASAPAPSVNTSLDGKWEIQSGGNITIEISGNTAVFSSFNFTSGYMKSAADKGYIKRGTQYMRNLTSKGNLTWSGQVMFVGYNTQTNEANGTTSWRDCTITMSADGLTVTENDGTVWRRQVPLD